jgi:hypothetical protein
VVSLPAQFGTEVNLNPLHTLLAACAFAGILVLILSFFNDQPLVDKNAVITQDTATELIATPAKSVGLASSVYEKTIQIMDTESIPTPTADSNNRDEF